MVVVRHLEIWERQSQATDAAIRKHAKQKTRRDSSAGRVDKPVRGEVENLTRHHVERGEHALVVRKILALQSNPLCRVRETVDPCGGDRSYQNVAYWVHEGLEHLGLEAVSESRLGLAILIRPRILSSSLCDLFFSPI